ncbi:MAG: hypothetical protein UV73_C0016G0013 [Candidatus Gottesmanbacteria bacterium GW2011_GWA2_43_14]|uniref:DUF5060 domain-containing protein n=1 Tax=Candidatus Gottesmanbacteria bacterium GW2011_GWA2_43_14 TaxID=1618443 RepID=A0A0G1DD44_9BACT|nr:MAG: hypothetical protein UV73_C0016G0013 [Candidatus Gottesmanbacteria bacterium GW2011_GWA2_43_14]
MKNGLLVLALLLTSLSFPQSIKAAPSVSSIQDNRSQYSGSNIPMYNKLEISFNISSSFKNPYLPFTNSPPAGIAPATGITVNGVFTSPSGQSFQQPGFYHQEFSDSLKSNKEWFYPTGNYSWKIRFSPDKTGTWQYKIRVTDSSGTTETPAASFSVIASGKHGFVKAASADPRYFEFDDGTYFPGLGFNLNAGNMDIENPVTGNQYEFEGMGANNIQLSRFWFSQKYVFGAAWSPWRSVNTLHQSQEPNPRISYPNDPNFKNAYPSLTMPPAASGSEVYWWLNADTTGGGNVFNYTPCLVTGGGWNLAAIPAKRNTNYRIRVRYRTLDMTGPFEVLHWSSTFPNQTSCTSPGGTVIASSSSGSGWNNSPDPQNPGWTIVSGTFNSGDRDFFNPIYISVAKAGKGHAFVDYIWLEEVIGSSFGPNLIYKPWVAQHYYVNQRNAYAFDKALAYAETKGLTFKPVILEKNDLLWRFFEYNGTLSAQPYSQNGDLFYGNGRETGGKTKTRFLHEAWWRYLQARWGYSTSIHSWELLNEGPPGPADGLHWIMVDELGKYMNCRVFDVTVSGKDCTYDHPNGHLVSTSFYGEGYPFFLWNNKDGNYPDVDYADQHMYARDEDPGFFDEAEFTSLLSIQRSALKADGTLNTQGAPKPFIRGETAWSGSADDLFRNNATNGLWLHNSIWGGINYGGMLEQYWLDGPGRCHIYNPGLPNCGTGGQTWDHRNEFGNFYKFIANVPLNKGAYIDAAPSVSNSNLRVFGQKHKTGNRAHLWIQNKNHTWKKVNDGVAIANQSGTVTVSGFSANKSLKVEWWNTYNGTVTSTSNMTTSATGSLTLSVSSLKDDIAVKIGDYTPVTSTPTTAPTKITPPITLKPGDANGDNKVDGLDYVVWLNHYNQQATGAVNGDFNNSGKIDGLDYVIWLNNYNK